MTAQKRITVGVLEKVLFPDLGGIEVLAKIDTGAYTGALHCTKIRLVETTDGKSLHFSPFDHPEIEVASREFKKRIVKSSNGGLQQRYFIKTTIKIKGKTYPITLSLADRSEMKWPVLIGRRFLRANNFLVDASI